MPINEKLSLLIPSQLPEFVRTNYDTFVAFLQAYYEYLQQDTQAQEIIQNAKHIRDIDLTVDRFVTNLFSEVASDLPKIVFNNVDPYTDVPLFQNVDEVNSKRAFVKRVAGLYQNKGAETSLKLLFKIFYDDEIIIDYPQKYMFRSSDGHWDAKQTIKVYDPTGNINLKQFVGKKVVGVSSNAFCIVDKVLGSGYEYANINVFELQIEKNSIRDDFIPGENIFCEGLNVTVKSLHVVQGIDIIDSGYGYVGGELLTLTGNGSSFLGYVKAVGDGGRIKTFDIKNFGAKYTVIDSVTVANPSVGLQGKYEYTDGSLLTAYFSTPHGLKANDIANITLSENTNITKNYVIREVPSATKFRIPFKNKNYIQWNLRGGNLIPSGESTWAGDYFGDSVSLSRDGSRMVVLASGYDGTVTNQGAAYIFHRAGNSWNQANIIVTPDPAADDLFYSSVSMSGDGKSVVLGARNWESATGNINVGAVYTFYESNATTNSWVQRGNILNLTANVPYDNFGLSISLSDNGNILAVGIPEKDFVGNIVGNVGAVYNYVRSGNDWIQRGDVLFQPGYNDEHNFGYAVALAGDGNILVVSSYRSGTSSYGNIYTYGINSEGNSWIQIADVIVGSTYGDRAYIGEKLALSKNGKILVATSNTIINGNVYANILTFDFDPELNYWDQRDYELSLLDENPSAYFPASPRAIKSLALANEGKILAVGEPSANISGNTNGGKITVFDSTFQASTGNISINPKKANLKGNIGILCNYTGNWVTKDGFTSSNIFLQDSNYYQNNSYVIKTGISSVYWSDILKRVINPVGMKFFAEVFVNLGDENLAAIDVKPKSAQTFINLILQLIEQVKVKVPVSTYDDFLVLNLNITTGFGKVPPTYRTLENFKFDYDNLQISEVSDIAIGNVEINYANSFVTPLAPPSEVFKTGSNLILNSAFTSVSDWTTGAGWAITAGNAAGTSTTSNLYQTGFILDNYATYAISYDIVNITSGSIRIFLRTSDYIGSGDIRNATGKYTDYFLIYSPTGSNAGNIIVNGITSFTGNICNITLRKFEPITN